MLKRSFQPRLASVGYTHEATCRLFSAPWLAQSAGLLNPPQNLSKFLLVYEEIRGHCMKWYPWVNNHRSILPDRQAGFPLNAMAPPFLRSFKENMF